MTALIALPARREGRPSNAALQLENRTLRRVIDDLSEERDELDMELRSWTTERVRAAALIVDMARRGQVALAAGHSPAVHLDTIERIATREAVRAFAARLPDDLA